MLRCGQRLPIDRPDAAALRAYGPDGFLGTATLAGGLLVPERMLGPAETAVPTLSEFTP